MVGKRTFASLRLGVRHLLFVIPTVVIRHPKERLSKCSLEPLRGREDITFYKARPGFVFDATGYVLLHHEGKALVIENGEWRMESGELADASPTDSQLSTHHSQLSSPRLLLLDSTWRLLPQLETCVVGEPVRVRLPGGVRTAYPRVSKIGENPLGGLASVEALYLARRLLGDDDPTLLDDYRWKDPFLDGLRKLGY